MKWVKGKNAFWRKKSTKKHFSTTKKHHNEKKAQKNTCFLKILAGRTAKYNTDLLMCSAIIRRIEWCLSFNMSGNSWDNLFLLDEPSPEVTSQTVQSPSGSHYNESHGSYWFLSILCFVCARCIKKQCNCSSNTETPH